MTNFKCLLNSFGYSNQHIISLKVTLGNSIPRGRGVWKFNTHLLIISGLPGKITSQLSLIQGSDGSRVNYNSKKSPFHTPLSKAVREGEKNPI